VSGQVIRVLGKMTRQADSKMPHRDTKTTREKHKYTVRNSGMQRDRNLIVDQRQRYGGGIYMRDLSLKYNVNRIINSPYFSKGVSLPDRDTKDIILQLDPVAIPSQFHTELFTNGEKLT
jgi:hypothetical protein